MTFVNDMQSIMTIWQTEGGIVVYTYMYSSSSTDGRADGRITFIKLGEGDRRPLTSCGFQTEGSISIQHQGVDLRELTCPSCRYPPLPRSLHLNTWSTDDVFFNT